MSAIAPIQEKRLRLYMDRLNDALNSPVGKSEKNSLPTTFKAEDLQGECRITVHFDGHSDADFRAFVTTFRQFTMPKEEAVYVNNIYQIIKSHCGYGDLKAWANFAIQRWNDLMASKPVVGFELDGKSYTNEDLLKLWLYSGRFHTDIAKANIWDSMPVMMRNDAEASVQSLTNKLLNCLVIIGSVIHVWLDEPTKAVPPVPTK